MQAPGFRMNEREANPNHFIAFIRALKRKKDHNDAEMILKAVAAQMKKIMEQRFMFVHTLEEAEFNRVFAGRNWNHGQSIELVLRGPSGRFLPLPYITSVMCHEMAHIEQMNHGPKFQKLMADIKEDVRMMQARGNFGDGFWSDGKRLRDSVQMGAEGLRPTDFPEYVCGVSAADARKARRPNRGPGASRGPGLVKGEASHLSGRQTEYRRKAGRRVNVDMGEKGARLDGQREITKIDREARKAFVDEQVERLRGEGMPATRAKARAVEIFDDTNPWYKTGNTRGKVAKSKTAAELRAAAAERRLASLTPKAENTEPESDSDHQDDSGSDDTEHQVDDPHLDADARRKEMEDEMNEDEMEGLRGGWEDFISERVGAGGTVITPSSAHPSPPQSGPSKRRASPEITPPAKKPATAKTIPSMFAPRLGANIVREERLRALGMISTTSARAGKSLGGPLTANVKAEVNDGVETDNRDIHPRDDGRPGWKCRQCTFINLMDHGRCEICQARPDGSIPLDL